MRAGEHVRLPDDCTIGYVISKLFTIFGMCENVCEGCYIVTDPSSCIICSRYQILLTLLSKHYSDEGEYNCKTFMI